MPSTAPYCFIVPSTAPYCFIVNTRQHCPLVILRKCFDCTIKITNFHNELNCISVIIFKTFFIGVGTISGYDIIILRNRRIFTRFQRTQRHNISLLNLFSSVVEVAILQTDSSRPTRKHRKSSAEDIGRYLATAQLQRIFGSHSKLDKLLYHVVNYTNTIRSKSN